MVRQNVSELLPFGRVFDKDGRGVESESNSASATPMVVDAVGKGKGNECFVCGSPSHAAGSAWQKPKTRSTPLEKRRPQQRWR